MKTTKKWSKMLLAGMVAMVLAFGLVVVGCDDGNKDGDPSKITPTIKLTDAGANTFTLTLTDATWQATDGGGIQRDQFIDALSGSNYSGFIDDHGELFYNYTKTSDTVLTVTVSKYAGETAAGSITLTLKSDFRSLDHYICIGSESIYNLAVVASDSGSVTITFAAD